MAKGKAKHIPKWESIQKEIEWDKMLDDHFTKLGYEPGTAPHALFGGAHRRIRGHINNG